MKRLWKGLALALGSAFFGWFLYSVGLAQVATAITSLGWLAPLVLLPYFLVYLVDCLAWSQILRRKDIPFPTLLRIRWAGESVNNVLPSAYVGGEAVKVGLLRSKGVGTLEGTTAAIVSKTAQTVAQMIFILVASVVFLVLTYGRPSLLGPLLMVALCSFAAVSGLFWIQKVGLFGLLLTLLEKLRVPAGVLQHKRAPLLRLDETILGFYRSHPPAFYASTSCYLAGWMLDSLEIWLVAYWLGMPIGWPEALVVEAFTGIAKAFGMWVPGSLGIQESGIVLIGRLVGLPDTLITAYALIRRAREAVFAGVGMVLLYGWDIFRRAAPVPASSQQFE